MGRRGIATFVVVMALGGIASLPGAATGDGLPVPGGLDTTGQGVLNSTGTQRYLAISNGDSTLVERIATGSGQLLRSRWIAGEYSVPGVAVDGDTSGISEDGGALVLIKPRAGFPQRETSLALFDPETLELKRRFDLDGDFSFDAISPDGSTAFLIQYPDWGDPTSYRLRTLDLSSGRIAPGSLLPENDPGEEMRGFPLARATGPGGRWEFTLYDGGRLYGYGPGEPGEPFVHAIDTVERRTLCIDLDWDIPLRRLDRLQLQLGDSGEYVEVVDPGVEVLGTIKIATGEATEGGPPSDATTESAEEGGIPLPALVSALAVVLIAAAGIVVRRRGSPG